MTMLPVLKDHFQILFKVEGYYLGFKNWGEDLLASSMINADLTLGS